VGFFQKKCVELYGVCQKQTMNCQKFSFWQRDRYFWHFGAGFWQTTDVRIVGKPINRAFVGGCRECQKFRIWQEWDVFSKVFGIYGRVFGSEFIIGWRKTTRTVSFCQKQEYP
jgi:hypothetical protein